MDIYKQLIAPFPANEIEWRVQSCGIKNEKPWAMVLAYVQARAIQRRLDEVFGWDGWTDEYRAVEKNMICRLSVKLEDGSWISKENGSSETHIEAFKGGISKSFVRVAASGYGIGRYLYDLTESFTDCSIDRKEGYVKATFKDKKESAKQKKDVYKTIYWKPPTLPEWALPKKADMLFEYAKKHCGMNESKWNVFVKDLFEAKKISSIDSYKWTDKEGKEVQKGLLSLKQNKAS